MEYTIEVAIWTTQPLTEQTLFAVAAIGGPASGNVGEHRIETTLTASGATIYEAMEAGANAILAVAPGVVIAAEGMTIEEADRRAA